MVTDPVNFKPAYLALHRSGELLRRARDAQRLLEACRVCPRNCGAARLNDETGVCQTGRYAQISSYAPHLGEEDCLRGWRGSGTIFFTKCSLRCTFCQNFDISQEWAGHEVGPTDLASVMLELQEMGCHNINFVTPSHVVPQLLQALAIAVEAGLRLPLVYNTSAYDSMESLQLLDGVVDIYMPDFKFWSRAASERYLDAANYPEVARQSIREMNRQVGSLQINKRGLAERGVLVRHLVMPGMVAETEQILRFLAEEIAPDTYVNVMAQYRPAGKVYGGQFPEIDRPLRAGEYETAIRFAADAGLRLDERCGGCF